MPDWEIRYYISTGQVDAPTTYGNCLHPEDIQNLELTQLRYSAHAHEIFTITAEIYGENTTWEYGDESGLTTQQRTPVTEFWPNVQFDGSRYDFITYQKFRQNYPAK
jgi:hypothetical protein